MRADYGMLFVLLSTILAMLLACYGLATFLERRENRRRRDDARRHTWEVWR